MPNSSKKNLSSQAHAASQPNVKPTTKANTSSVESNSSKPDHKPKNIKSGEYLAYPKIGVGITDGAVSFAAVALHNHKDQYRLRFEDLPKELVDYMYSRKTERADYVTSLVNKNMLLESQLKGSPFSFSYIYGNKKVELKSAYDGLQDLYKFDLSFASYKDAIARCLFLIANSEDNLFDEKEVVQELYLIFNFFNDLEKDIVEN